MSAAISVANVGWKFKASIASFVFLLPQDVTDAASMVLAVDLGSFGMEASRDHRQEMIADPVVRRQLGELWSDVRPVETDTFEVHAQIDLTDTQVFMSTQAIADWGGVLETRTADSRRLMSPVSLKLLIDGSLDQTRLVAALECTSGVEISTTPEQLRGLVLVQQIFVGNDVTPSSSGDSVVSGQPLGSPERLTFLGSASCAHVSWSLVSEDSREPVVTAAMRRLVLCSAAFPEEEQFRGLFRLNSISMHSGRSTILQSGCVDDTDKDLVDISYQAGIGVAEPAEMDVKLQQLTLTCHPEVINTIRALCETYSSAEGHRAVAARVKSSTARSRKMQRGLRVRAELTVLRLDLAVDNEVKYCAKVSGAHASAEFRVDSSTAIQGQVQTLQIEDHAVVSKWRRFVGVADGHDESLIEFTYKNEDDESHLELVVQSPMQFIYHPGLTQGFADYLSVSLIAATQQMMQAMTGVQGQAPPRTPTSLAIVLKLRAPNVVYALSSSSTKSLSFDLCDLRMDYLRSSDGTQPVTTVRMVDPSATIRGLMVSDFCGIVAETLSVHCSMQMFTLHACGKEVAANGLASATISMLNQREGAWQVLCSVPSTVVNVERECDVWNLTCEAAENERISVNIRDSFLNTLSQSFVNVDEASCTIKNQSGLAILFAVATSAEQRLDHGAHCALLASDSVAERGSVGPPLLRVRPAFEDEYEVPPVTLPLTETNEFVRDFTTSGGEKISIRITTELVDGALHVTCRSLIEVENTGAVAVDVPTPPQINGNLPITML